RAKEKSYPRTSQSGMNASAIARIASKAAQIRARRPAWRRASLTARRTGPNMRGPSLDHHVRRRRATPRAKRPARAQGRVPAAQHVLLRLHEEHLEGGHLHQDRETARCRHDIPVQSDAAVAVVAARAPRRGALG